MEEVTTAVTEAVTDVMTETAAEMQDTVTTTVTNDGAANELMEVLLGTDQNGEAVTPTLAPKVSEVAENANNIITGISEGSFKGDLVKSLLKALWNYLPTILLAALLYIIGRNIIILILKGVKKALDKLAIAEYGRDFILKLLKIVLTTVNICITFTILGFPALSLLVLVLTFTAAAAITLKDGINSILAGLSIMVTKPFIKGSYIRCGEYEGFAGKIGIRHTEITTYDNKILIVPNEKLVNDVVVNYSRDGMRRVDYGFSISYESDLETAKKIITDIMAEHELVIHEKGHFARVTDLADSGVTVTARAWVSEQDYWTVYYDLLEGVKKGFDEAGIVIPYPHLTLDMKDAASAIHKEA